MNTEQELQRIIERNYKVEANKAWGISKTRRFMIAIVTYVLALGFLLLINAENAFLAACVPVIGFLLSTLDGKVIRKYWENKN